MDVRGLDSGSGAAEQLCARNPDFHYRTGGCARHCSLYSRFLYRRQNHQADQEAVKRDEVGGRGGFSDPGGGCGQR
ncbi:hypothetical protein D3C75_1158380 [compost metagenome]